jgi:hypothetical protein
MIRIQLFDTQTKQEVDLTQLTASGLEILSNDLQQLQQAINQCLNDLDGEGND